MAYTMAQAIGLGLPMAGASDYSPPQATPVSTPMPAPSPVQAQGGNVQNIGGSLYYVDTGDGTAAQAQAAMQAAAPGVNLGTSPLVPTRGATQEQRWDVSQWVTPEVRALQPAVEPTKPYILAPQAAQLTPLSMITPMAQSQFTMPLTMSAMVGLNPSPSTSAQPKQQLQSLQDIQNSVASKMGVPLATVQEKWDVKDKGTGKTLAQQYQDFVDANERKTTSVSAAVGLPAIVPMKTTVQGGVQTVGLAVPLPDLKETDTIEATFPGEAKKSMTVGEYRAEVSQRRDDFIAKHPEAVVYDNGQKWVGLTSSFVDLKKNNPDATITETKPDGTTSTILASSMPNSVVMSKMMDGSTFEIATQDKVVPIVTSKYNLPPVETRITTGGQDMVWNRLTKEYKMVSPQGTYKLDTEESDWLKGMVSDVLSKGADTAGKFSDVIVRPAAELIGGKELVAKNIGAIQEGTRLDIKGISSEIAKIVQPSVSVKILEDPLYQRMEAAKYKLPVGDQNIISKLAGTSDITVLGSRAGGQIEIDAGGGKTRLANIGDLYAKKEQYIEEAKKLEGPFGIAKLGVDIEGSAQRVEKQGALGSALAGATEYYIKTNYPGLGTPFATETSKLARGVGDVLGGPTAFGARTGAQAVEAGYQFATGGLEQSMRWRERIAQGAKAAGMEYGAEGGTLSGLTVPGAIKETLVPGSVFGFTSTPGAHYTGSLRKQLEGARESASGATMQAGVTGALYAGLGAVGAKAKASAEAAKATATITGTAPKLDLGTKILMSTPLGISGVTSGTQLASGAPPEKIIGAFLGPQLVSGVASTVQTSAPGLSKIPGKIQEIVAPKVKEIIKWDTWGETPQVSTFKIKQPSKTEFKIEGGEVKEVPVGTPDKVKVVTVARTGGEIEGYSAKTGRSLGSRGEAEFVSTSKMTSRDLTDTENLLGTVGGENIKPAGVASGTTVTYTTLPGRAGVKIYDTTETPLNLFGKEPGVWRDPMSSPWVEPKANAPLGLFYDTTATTLKPIKIAYDVSSIPGAPGGMQRVTAGSESQYISYPGVDGKAFSVKTGGGFKGIETDFWKFDAATGLLKPVGTKQLSLTGPERLYPELYGPVELQTSGTKGAPVPTGFTGIRSFIAKQGIGSGEYVTGEAGTIEPSTLPARQGYGLSLQERGKPTIYAGVESKGIPTLPSSVPKDNLGYLDLPWIGGRPTKSTALNIPGIGWGRSDTVISAGPEVGQRPLGLFYPSETGQTPLGLFYPSDTVPPVTTKAPTITPTTPSPIGDVLVKAGGQVQVLKTETRLAPQQTTQLTQPTELTGVAAALTTAMPVQQAYAPQSSAQIELPQLSASMFAPAIQVFAPAQLKYATAEKVAGGIEITKMPEPTQIYIPKLKSLENVLPGIQIQQPRYMPAEGITLEKTLPGITVTLPPIGKTTTTQPTDIVPGILVPQPPIQGIKIEPPPEPPTKVVEKIVPPEEPKTGRPYLPPVFGGGGGAPQSATSPSFASGLAPRPLSRKKKSEAYASLLNVMRAQIAGYKGVSAPTYQSYTSELNLPTLEQMQGKVGKTFDFAPKINVFTQGLASVRIGTPKLTMGNMLRVDNMRKGWTRRR